MIYSFKGSNNSSKFRRKGLNFQGSRQRFQMIFSFFCSALLLQWAPFLKQLAYVQVLKFTAAVGVLTWGSLSILCVCHYMGQGERYSEASVLSKSRWSEFWWVKNWTCTNSKANACFTFFSENTLVFCPNLRWWALERWETNLCREVYGRFAGSRSHNSLTVVQFCFSRFSLNLQLHDIFQGEHWTESTVTKGVTMSPKSDLNEDALRGDPQQNPKTCNNFLKDLSRSAL